MHDEQNGDSRQDLDDPIVYRDLSDQLPHEALRDELERMTAEVREAYLEYLEKLSKTYLGPGGP